MLGKAAEMIGAHFAEARAEIIKCITDDPLRMIRVTATWSRRGRRIARPHSPPYGMWGD